MRTLKDKVLFITGASRGIGKAIALRAAKDGAKIAVVAKTSEPHPRLPGTVYTAVEDINNEGGTIVGNPTIEGAKVIAMSHGEVKGEKVLVGKYKAKTRYRRKKGHRQKYTQIEVQNIIEPGVKNGA